MTSTKEKLDKTRKENKEIKKLYEKLDLKYKALKERVLILSRELRKSATEYYK